jgi:hypothetical protein
MVVSQAYLVSKRPPGADALRFPDSYAARTKDINVLSNMNGE